ncbi:P-loop NTPase [Cryobacterium sp. Hz9]|uniref:nucleotide-binding protein n=1 Tax=Cryobacterium sp. Hz9 TaxID=1259167 RepID=UPI001069712A|nr:hypothetical protein E3N85_07510 [Cryobacterium sp. Hz9]
MMCRRASTLTWQPSKYPGGPSLCSRKADLGRADRSFVVAPSTGGEGKSTTSSNLAIARSDAGARFLLVDADLRSPKIAESTHSRRHRRPLPAVGGRAHPRGCPYRRLGHDDRGGPGPALRGH